MLIKDILPVMLPVRSFENDLINTTPAVYKFNSFPRIPFEQRVLAYVSVHCDLICAVTDKKQFTQICLKFFSETVFLFDFIP